MAEITLKATRRTQLGDGPSKRLRAEGKIPGVVYGLDADPIPVTVEWRPLREALTTDAGLNALIDLDVEGDVSLTIVKELQRHPIRGDVLHLDFLRVSADAAITVDVPVVLEGEATAVLNENATVDQILFTLAISAKPADIPNELTVDISEMQVGDNIRVADVKLPAGVTTDLDPEEPVVTTQVQMSEDALETEGAEVEGGEAEATPEAGEAADAGEAAESGDAAEGDGEG